jgi:hypothetical protein
MNGMHGWVVVHPLPPPDWGSAWHFAARPMGSYNALVDLMGHKDLGGKTVLFLADGLYAGENQSSASPWKWQSAPFSNNWTSSFFASQDGVAIESVALDFLRSEPQYSNTVYGNVDNYLHEAAQANNPPSGTFYDPEGDGTNLTSLGVHEHWNDSTNKMYTRNLGTGSGIELISGLPTLRIESAYGTAVPPAGIYTNEFNTALTNAVLGSPLKTGTTQYMCTGWTWRSRDTATGIDTNMTMNLTNDTVLTWNWITNYWLNIGAVTNGHVDIGVGWHAQGASVAAIATPDPYYHFAGWTDDTNGCSFGTNGIMITMDGPRRIRANFDQNLAPKGTPEWWLAANGLTNSTPNIEELMDSDGDGTLNWEEWAAGTDPTNATSVFRIVDLVTSESGRMPMTFSSVSGHIYQLWSVPFLDTGTWSLVQYATNEAGSFMFAPITANVNAVTVYFESASTTMFYRVKTQ